MNDSYPALYQNFNWRVPKQFNIAYECCHRWAESVTHARRIALYYELENGQREVWTYERLGKTSQQLANGLTRIGIEPGDRIAIILGQRPENVAAQMAIYSVGAIAVFLSTSLESDKIAHRLNHSQARAVFVDKISSNKLLSISQSCPTLDQIIGIDFTDERVLAWRTLLARQAPVFKILPTQASDPAILLYPSSNSQQSLQAVLLPHAVLIGNLPGFVASQNWFPKDANALWSPSDWVDEEGLLSALLPTLYFGHAIVGTLGPFSVKRSFELLHYYPITNLFLMSSKLENLLQSIDTDFDNSKLKIQAIASPGGYHHQAIFDACYEKLGIRPNSVFGLQEMNAVIGDSQLCWPTRPYSLGRAYPGHQIAIIDSAGHPLGPGKIGEIALNRYDLQGHFDPALFLHYWQDEATTEEKFIGNWYCSGKIGCMDADGYLWDMQTLA